MQFIYRTFIFIICLWYTAIEMSFAVYETNCSSLLMGQYNCSFPDIDIKTQQPRNCQPNNKARTICSTANGIACKNGTGINATYFEMDIDCQYTNGYSFEIALLLSLFLGMFGLDRFYLGYPAIGLAKLCTMGFMFLGQLIDVILIAMQVVRPSDGSYYVISYFGPKLTVLRRDNDTYIMPQDDW